MILFSRPSKKKVLRITVILTIALAAAITYLLQFANKGQSLAAPTISSITETTFSSNATSHAVAMPATIDSGDLLLVFFTNDGNATVTTPDGWWRLWSDANGTAVRGLAYARVARGNEDGTTVDFVTSASEEAAAQVYRITNWSGTMAGVNAGVSGQTSDSITTADPPSLTPYFGQADTLWIAVVHSSTSQTVNSGPTSYTNLTSTTSNADNNGARVTSARRTNNVATEDPDVFTFSSTGASKVYDTIAIAPSGTGPTREHFDTTQNGTTLWTGMYTSQPFAATDTNITRAVIVIHGSTNNAHDYYNYVKYNLRNETGVFIAAPQFIEDTDDPETDQLFWTSVWREMGRSDPSLTFRVSSGTVMDNFIAQLYTSFPNLQGVIISGFSAGGQYVNRYSAASSDTRNRYLAGSPSSFVYTNADRPDGLGGFAEPVTSCSTYDDWKFGLQNLSTTSYINAIGETALSNNLRNSVVTYMVGSLDTDPAESSLDLGCEAELQGAHRVERMTNYYDFLDYKYGTTVYDTHTMVTVTGFAHESANILGSSEAYDVYMQTLPPAPTPTPTPTAVPTPTPAPVGTTIQRGVNIRRGVNLR